MAGAARSERFARYLANAGWRVDIITINPRKDLFVDANRLKTIRKLVNVHQTDIFDPWLRISKNKNSSFLVRGVKKILLSLTSFPDHMIFWVPSVVRNGMKLFRDVKYNVIYTTSPPHSSHLSGLILHLLTKRPWVADFRDPWTINALYVRSKLLKPLIFVEKKLEKAVLKKATVILANTPLNRKKLLESSPYVDKKKVVYLPNGWEEFPQDVFIGNGFKEIGIRNDKFTIIHAGKFYPRFKPYALLHAVAMWDQGKQPIGISKLDSNKFQIILLGGNDAATKQTVDKLKIQKYVKIIPWVSQLDSRKIMSKADLLWATLGTGNESATYVPSKIFEYISAKRPIIGFFPEGDAASLIKETSTGTVFSSDNSIQVIEFLYQKMTTDDGNASYNPNKEVVKKFHVNSISSQLEDLLQSILKY